MVDGHSSSSAAYMNLEDLEELVMLLFWNHVEYSVLKQLLLILITMQQ